MHTTRCTTIVSAFMTVAALFVAQAAGQSPSFTTITGEIGPGALYEIAMPTAVWNGGLVVFAQGIGNPNVPITLPNLGPLRETLTSQGFAVVYTSRSVNGYGAVKDGMQRTHQLSGIFAETIGQPSRVYLFGRSLGGLIAVALAERSPGQYDGALSGCGLLDGGAAELTYVADGRMLFDYFFPGVIPGTPFDAPPGVDFSPGGLTFNAVNAALVQGPPGSGPSSRTGQADDLRTVDGRTGARTRRFSVTRRPFDGCRSLILELISVHSLRQTRGDDHSRFRCGVGCDGFGGLPLRTRL